MALLLGCHARIRAFTSLAISLARLPAPDADVARAAEDVLRYFTEALPLHEADEEEDLLAAFRAHAPHDTWGPLCASLAAEHRAIDAAIAKLVPLWTDVARAPSRLAIHRDELAENAVELEALFAPHLALEEDRVFPLARRYFPPSALSSLLEAFRQRRHLAYAS